MHRYLVSAEQALKKNVEASLAEGTRKLYRSAIKRWRGQGGEIPADPYQLALYLSDLNNYVCVSTVRVHAAAIAAAHVNAGYENPFRNSGIRAVLAGMYRRSKHVSSQARGIDADKFEAVTDHAATPRVGRGGRMETQRMADRRALLDVTLIGVMRDAMLRRSEAEALLWNDMEMQEDGSGRLLIRRSKTDQTGEGSVRYISAPVMECVRALCLTHGESITDKRVFDMSAAQINRRIAQAAQAAGLEGKYSGHSPRIGMAQDLARFGCGLPELMEAGRWKSPSMPAYYLRSIDAGRGAVANFYGNA